MPRIHPPAGSSPPPFSTLRCEVCEACGRQMRLVTIEPYPLYTNIDMHNYTCDCGQSKELFVCRWSDLVD
jgi:hypothetical protein